MANNMPKPNAALNNFLKDNRIYAALFNGYLFHGNEVITAAELKPVDTAYAETAMGGGKATKVERYRDNLRISSQGYLVVLGVENQDKIHYAMPLRKLLYDALGYCSEITAAGRTQDHTEWTIDEMLSGASKGTKMTPIITIVFYTGEKVWDGPTSLYDMMEIDDQLKPFVPDYPLFVIDMGHDSTLSFPNESLESLRIALWDIYHSTGDHDETEIQNNILALAGILANDVKLYRRANNNKGGTITMCEALRKRDEAIRKEVEGEVLKSLNGQGGTSTMCKALQKRDEAIRKEVEGEVLKSLNGQGGTSTMCKALQKRDEALTKKVQAEMRKSFKEKEEAIRREVEDEVRKKVEAEKDAALAEIRALKQQLLAYQMAE